MKMPNLRIREGRDQGDFLRAMKDLDSKENEKQGSQNLDTSVVEEMNPEEPRNPREVAEDQFSSEQGSPVSEVSQETPSQGPKLVSDEDNVQVEFYQLEQENTQLKSELSELKDQYLRKQADFDNFRKRLIRDKEESIQFANRKIMEDLVPVIDDFERAIKSSEDSKDFQLLHDGIQLIEKQLVSMLEKKWGLLRFDSLDQEFDPQKHEAVSAEPREGEEVQKVLEEYQKGFLLNDRVLRTAKVKVSMPVMKGE